MRRLIPIFFAFMLFSACAGMQPEPARQLTLEETLRLAEEAGAGKKISDLSQETSIQDTDEVLIRRGSNNYRAQVQHLPSANPSDQFNQIKNAYYVSTNASVTDHADTAQSGSIADVITNEMSGVHGDIILPGNKTYQIKQALTIPVTARLMPQKGAIIDTDISVRSTSYKWTLSGSGTSEYYLEASGGGNPNINEPDDMAEDDSLMTEATVGSLSAGEWDWGNNDTLGFNTVYVRLSDSTDPDGKAADYVDAGYTLTINSPFEPDAYQVFSGIGRVVFGPGSVKEAYPEWHGAVGDGITDDISAFTKIASSLQTIGGIIAIGGKTYILSTTWTLYDNITVQYEGGGGVLKKAATQTSPIITAAGLTGVRIYGLKLDGNKTNQSVSDANRMGIYAPDAVNLVIKNCYITATSHAGVYTRNGATDVKIINNTFNNCGQETGTSYPAVYITGIDGVSDSVLIEGNHFENNKYAVAIRSGGGTEGNNVALRQVRVIGNSFLDNGRGVNLSHTENSIISDNTFYNDEAVRAVGGSFIDFQGHCNNVSVSNNNINTTDLTYHGIQVANDVTDISVIANSINGGGDGIVVAGSGTYNIVVDANNIKNSNTAGILVDTSASTVTINANILTDNAANTTNIRCQNSVTDIIITNNIIKGTGGAGEGIAFTGSTNVIEDNNIIEGFQYNWTKTTFTSLDTTPDVSSGKFFSTNNGGATIITMFDGPRQGQEITVFFGDVNTTIDFTATNLKGNAGVDWTPAYSDFLRAWFNGTNWYCEVHDTTI